ncbi:MAG: purine-nucleoside phosphorylase [Bdellovibrionales bacterium]|nr:purine-nucleoside phosphorylase [Bdellovibrionales bacterium]
MNPQDQVHQFKESADFLRKHFDHPKINATIVLGSGLKNFEDEIQNPISISYQDIPHFPQSSVQGHGHKLVLGQIHNQTILAFTGRFHYYQGIDITTTALPAWISAFLDVPTYILTNAAGGVNPNFEVGNLVLIKDHINPSGLHPVRGVHLENWENPFFDTSNLYNADLRNEFLTIAKSNQKKVSEGVYCFLPGPNFETPAEISMLRTLGVDLVGMSSVPEALAAHKLGLDVLGLSVVTNVYPTNDQPKVKVNHQEVLNETNKASATCRGLIKDWIQTW